MFNMKKCLLTFGALLWMASWSLAQTARVQVIHNAPNPTVDVYVNGVLAIDNFAFRTARPFLDLPAGLPLSIEGRMLQVDGIRFVVWTALVAAPRPPADLPP